MLKDVQSVSRESTRLRSQAIEAKIALSFTFCRVAENAILLGRPDRAQRLLDILRHTHQSLDQHVNKPGHADVHETQRFHRELRKLKQQIARLALLFANTGPNKAGDN